MINKCRVVFMCVLYVLMCFVLVSVVANTLPEQVAGTNNFGMQAGKNKFVTIRMVKYYKYFFEKALEFLGALFWAAKFKESQKCELSKDQDKVNETLNKVRVAIESKKNLIKETLRLTDARTIDEKTVNDMEKIADNSENASPELLMAIGNMTVTPEEIEKVFVMVNEIVAEVNKTKDEVEELKDKTKCLKTKHVGDWLMISLHYLNELKTAAEEAKKWQNELFAQPEPEKIETKKEDNKDELQPAESGQEKELPQTVKKKEGESKPEQKQQSVPSEENKTTENLSFDGSVAVGYQNSVVFFAFLFVTASAVIAGV